MALDGTSIPGRSVYATYMPISWGGARGVNAAAYIPVPWSVWDIPSWLFGYRTFRGTISFSTVPPKSSWAEPRGLAPVCHDDLRGGVGCRRPAHQWHWAGCGGAQMGGERCAIPVEPKWNGRLSIWMSVCFIVLFLQVLTWSMTSLWVWYDQLQNEVFGSVHVHPLPATENA